MTSYSIKALPTAIVTMTLILATVSCAPSASDLTNRLPDDPQSESDFTATEGTGEISPMAYPPAAQMRTPQFTASERAQILAKYDHLDPNQIVPTVLLQEALFYLEANSSRFANKRYLSVIDFSMKSSRARFFIVDMGSGSVWAIHTSHGKGSDANHDGYAESFGNVSGSNATSLGFYKTAETYYGSHGLSMRLDGLSSSNSNARARAIVIHPANYVSESNVIQGRSQGCPAVAPENRDRVIERLKGGSLIFAGLSNR